MDGLILAAGTGTRLGSRSPKCLARVGGRSLLDLQLEALARSGADNVTVVVGYRHEEVRAAAFGEANFVYNPRFAETNSLYSFLLAQAAVKDDVLVLNGDVLFPFELLRRLLEPEGSAFAFDSGSGLEDEHMKVQLSRGRLVRMSKQLPTAQVHGENVGVLHLSAQTAQAAFLAAAELVSAGHHRAWIGSAVTAIAGGHEILGVDMLGLPWVEIDFPADLALARSEVWPAIGAFQLFADRRAQAAGIGSGCDTTEAAVG